LATPIAYGQGKGASEMLFDKYHRGDLGRLPCFALTTLFGMLKPLKELHRFAINRVGMQKLLSDDTHRRKPFGYF